ncbi:MULTISPECIES: tripartite tricarboxylate transporter TctB family protein [Roseobacteraceae]|jgi:hypothetical protein|uniref:Tripartite tricarboxylate transporter TctB family protein n=1 Tax=Pseudosulfitobacter pseudonitzschiae TaxID=1402135 RepID=A0A221JXC6_9RHOB|nr:MULTISPECIES: tripartite tricarboxylate transporter TctB family protein [Roseobacteraceae]ASM71395.1 tripartite tricarboxylate transporter TctB family protein [Pseudosulfitobacter pseudonitzschiae]
MTRFKGLQELFKRYRRPGDVVFAWVFLLFSVFLLTQLDTQSPWKQGGKIFSQPAFWPTVSIYLMVFFSALHLLSSVLSPRLHGRWGEVWQWVRTLEYAGWFMAYVLSVPVAGYLPCTVVFAVLLALRAGYRQLGTLAGAAVMGVVIVVAFKAFLQVKIPGGAVYEYLPTGLRAFMLTYF